MSNAITSPRSPLAHQGLRAAALTAGLSASSACGGNTAPPLLNTQDVTVDATDVAADGVAEQDANPADVADDAAEDVADTTPPPEPVSLRVATFNASLFRSGDGDLRSDLPGGADADALRVAEVLQRVRPDIVLINEFDWDDGGEAARVFSAEYLAVGQNGAEALEYPYWYVPTTNTGAHSGVDLDGNGEAVSAPGSQSYGNDAFGFGQFPGQYGMVVFSRYVLDAQRPRTFQTLRWADMPDNLLPTDWYSEEAASVFRLSSKNHVDLAVDVDGHTLHILASHPTPPSFDGSEDRNGRRNHDEIRLWNDYVTGGQAAAYIQDDAGTAGGLDASAHFVILGDQNSDPNDGDSRREALTALLANPRVQDTQPASDGAAAAAISDGRVNQTHTGDARLDTADFSDNQVGNLRVDYALPSATLQVVDSGVFWPAPDTEFADLENVSDHHLVWVDIVISAEPAE